MSPTQRKKPTTKPGEPVDFLALPVDGECDLTDVFSHHYVEVIPWHAEAGAVGEFRTLRCDRPGCDFVMGQVRAVDPENPLPVPEPLQADAGVQASAEAIAAHESPLGPQ